MTGKLPSRLVVRATLLAAMVASRANGQDALRSDQVPPTESASSPEASGKPGLMKLLARKGMHDVKDESWNAYGQFTYISPISTWELGLLASRGRIQLLIAPQRWFARLFESRGVRLAEMSPDVLVASSFLPGKPPRDPADRIIAATARDLGATLITRDRALLG